MNDRLLSLIPEFQTYLIRIGNSAHTARTYAGQVAALIRYADDQPITADLLRDMDEEAAFSTRCGRRTAWRAFGAWLATMPDAPQVPPMPSANRGRPRAMATQQDVLLAALHARMGNTAAIANLRWGDVSKHDDHYVLTFRVKDSTINAPVSREWLRAVKECSYPLSPVQTDAPLFPAVREGDEPLSAWRVQTAVRRARDAIFQGRMEAWKKPPRPPHAPLDLWV